MLNPCRSSEVVDPITQRVDVLGGLDARLGWNDNLAGATNRQRADRHLVRDLGTKCPERRSSASVL